MMNDNNEKQITAMRSAVKYQLLNNYDVEDQQAEEILDDYVGYLKRAVNLAQYPYSPADRIAEAVGLTYNGNLDKLTEEDDSGTV